MITGPFVLLSVPRKLFVSGDVSGSSANTLAHQTLCRTYIMVGLVGHQFFLASVLAFQRLLSGVSAGLAAIVALVMLLIGFDQQAGQVPNISTPILFGEASLMLWLLIMGVRVKRPEILGAPA